ncbi:MAG: zinc ribbon domain-containing protein [Oscillospiraceae bacterium]
MNCNKCGGAIPEESKFCPHCGAMQTESKKDIFCIECGLMLQPGTLFCPVCGTSADGTKPSAQAIPAVSADSMPAVSGDMGTVSAIPQPVPQPASAPVREATPSDAVFGAYNAAYGSELKPSDIAFAKPSDAVFGTSRVSLEKPSDSEVTAQPEQARPYAPEQTYSPPEQTALPKKSSKKWVGPVIGAAAAAVVVGGGAIAYNVNKADITNMIMGDSAYARMIEQSSVKQLTDSADTAAISKAAGSVVAAAASANLTETNIKDLENITYGAIDGDLSEISSGSGTEVNIASVIEQLNSQLLSLTGYSGADVKIGVEAKITETLRALITEGESEENDSLNEILNIINSSELQFTVLSAKDSASMYWGINDASASFSFGISGLVYSDGTVGIIFPNTSDTAIKYTIEADDTISYEQTALPEIDEKEIERLKNELIDLYLSYYEKGEITVTAENDVKNITVKITSEQATEMVKQAAALIAEDEYFSKTIVDYINANGGSITVDEYKSSIMDSVKDMQSNNDAVMLITTSVDKQNNILAKKFAVENAEKYYSEFGYKTEGKNTELFALVRNDKTQEFTVLITAENAADGVVTISFDEYDEAKVENGEEFILDIKYKDCKLEKFGKTQTLTGNYEISSKKAISLDTSDEYNSSTAALAALQSAKIVIDSKLEADNTLIQSFMLEVPQYGSIALKMTETLTNDAPATLPNGALDVNKFSSGELSEDDIKELTDSINELRDDINAKCENSRSKLAKYLKEGANEIVDSLLDEISPKATESAINTVNEMADRLNDKCYSYSNNYNEVMDEELQDELNSLIQRINSSYLWGEVSLEDLSTAQTELAKIEAEIEEFGEKLEKASKKKTEAMYNDMDTEELEAAKFSLDFLYDMIADEFTTQIDADEELYEAFREVTEKKDKCDKVYAGLESMFESGNIQIGRIRDLRKAEAAYDIALTQFISLLQSKVVS